MRRHAAGPPVLRTPGLLVLALALAACATAPPLGTLPPGAVLPDLRGTWAGTWGGVPATLLITEQRDAVADGGLFIGTAAIFGDRRPGLGAVLTSSIDGRPVSTNARGWLGQTAGRLALRLHAESSHGLQRLDLVLHDDDWMTGTGESSFRWGPQGAVHLRREQGAPVAAGPPGHPER
jgi:hypothetical protein